MPATTVAEITSRLECYAEDDLSDAVCVDMKQSSSLSMADERAQQTQAREDRSRGYNDSRTCTSSAQCQNGGTCAARSCVCRPGYHGPTCTQRQ